MNKSYHIEITGVGPASNGNSDTDADLQLQSLLATLTSVGHRISKAQIIVNGHRLVLLSEKGVKIPLPQTTEDAAAEVQPDRLDEIIKKLIEIDRTGKATFETLAKLTPREKGKRAATAGKKEGGGAKEDAEPGNDTPPSTGTEAPAPTPEPQEPGSHGEPDAPTTPEP